MSEVAFTTRSLLTPGVIENITDVTDCLDKLLAGVNDIDKEQLSNALAQLLGMNNGATSGRGKSIIATEETRASASYGTLATPDQVTITLPTDGLIFIAYQAMWKVSSGAVSANAAIFLGANQIKTAMRDAAAPATVAAGLTTARAPLGGYTTLSTYPGGLRCGYNPTTAYTGDVTTGQILGVPQSSAYTADPNDQPLVFGSVCGPIFAAANTYTVSVQYQSDPAITLAVKNRKLWVWSVGF